MSDATPTTCPRGATPWRQPRAPWVERWLERQATFVSEKTIRQRRAQLRRALEVLGLERAGDLRDLARLEDRLLELRQAGATVVHLRRCYQQPLRQLSAWLAGNRRLLEHDPLAAWEPFGRLEADGVQPGRRAYTPDEVARALLALDRLHTIHRRAHRLRPAFTTLLVAGPRLSRLLACRVSDLDLQQQRIDFGPGRGRKRTGVGALDSLTLAEVLSNLADRDGHTDLEDRLFVSPEGVGLRKERALDWWREAFSLGAVDALWPRDEPASLRLLHLVSGCLLSGRVKLHKGGRNLRPETLARMATLAERVHALASRLRPAWERRLQRVDLHSLRKTHRTWAEARGVPPVVVDKQLGHRAGAGSHELSRLFAGSWTGRHHYLDLSSSLFDARRSAEAVRGVLEEALAALLEEGTSLLVP